MNPYTISPIVDGQYHVWMYLDEWMPNEKILEFHNCYDELCKDDDDFKKVCFFDGRILRYRSESLFPLSNNIDPKKKKVMIIVGNPATHSVVKGMFFYSKGEKNARHPFWGKLKEAGLIRSNPNMNDREIEAQTRKKDILNGNTSDEYILGLTTFYSLPTPVKPRDKKKKSLFPARTKYGDAAGVEELFKAALSKLQKMEYDRLNSYDFTKGAVWVFTQLSSYRYVQSISRTEYWPMTSMSSGSGGKDLKKILLMP